MWIKHTKRFFYPRIPPPANNGHWATSFQPSDGVSDRTKSCSYSSLPASDAKSENSRKDSDCDGGRDAEPLTDVAVERRREAVVTEEMLRDALREPGLSAGGARGSVVARARPGSLADGRRAETGNGPRSFLLLLVCRAVAAPLPCVPCCSASSCCARSISTSLAAFPRRLPSESLAKDPVRPTTGPRTDSDHHR